MRSGRSATQIVCKVGSRPPRPSGMSKSPPAGRAHETARSAAAARRRQRPVHSTLRESIAAALTGSFASRSLRTLPRALIKLKSGKGHGNPGWRTCHRRLIEHLMGHDEGYRGATAGITQRAGVEQLQISTTIKSLQNVVLMQSLDESHRRLTRKDSGSTLVARDIARTFQEYPCVQWIAEKQYFRTDGYLIAPWGESTH